MTVLWLTPYVVVATALAVAVLLVRHRYRRRRRPDARPLTPRSGAVALIVIALGAYPYLVQSAYITSSTAGGGPNPCVRPMCLDNVFPAPLETLDPATVDTSVLEVTPWLPPNPPEGFRVRAVELHTVGNWQVGENPSLRVEYQKDSSAFSLEFTATPPADAEPLGLSFEPVALTPRGRAVQQLGNTLAVVDLDGTRVLVRGYWIQGTGTLTPQLRDLVDSLEPVPLDELGITAVDWAERPPVRR